MDDGPPPRVMHLRSSCGFYGAEGVIHTLVHAYRGESTVACLADSRDPHTELCDRLSAEGRTALSIATRGAVDPFVLRRFGAAIRAHHPRVIHCHEYKSAVIAAIVGRSMRRGLVFTVHGDLRETVGSRAFVRLGHWALRRFHSVVGVSATTAADAREYGVDPARVHLIPNAVDTDRFQPCLDRGSAREALGIPGDGVLIGVVGRLSAEKAHAVLLDAASRLRSPWRLAVAGDGTLEGALRDQAQGLGIADRVHFLGRVEEPERVYAALDILALASYHEGLPLTVLEAAACGLPVVSTDVGDVSRVVLEGKTGLLVPPEDPEALAGALERMLGDACLRAAFGAAGREHIAAAFGASAMADAYEALYREAAAR